MNIDNVLCSRAISS